MTLVDDTGTDPAIHSDKNKSMQAYPQAPFYAGYIKCNAYVNRCPFSCPIHILTQLFTHDHRSVLFYIIFVRVSHERTIFLDLLGTNELNAVLDRGEDHIIQLRSTVRQSSINEQPFKPRTISY